MNLRVLGSIGIAGASLAVLGWALLALNIITGSVAVVLVVLATATVAVTGVLVARRLARRAGTRMTRLQGEISALTQTVTRESEHRRQGDERAGRHRAWIEALQASDNRAADDAEALLRRVRQFEVQVSRTVEADAAKLHARIAEGEGALEEKFAAAEAVLAAHVEDLSERAARADAAREEQGSILANHAEVADQIRRDVVVLRRRSKSAEDERTQALAAARQLKARVGGLEAELLKLRGEVLERAVLDGADLTRTLSEGDIQRLVPALIEQDRPIPLVALVRRGGIVSGLNLTQARALFKMFRAHGYWRLQQQVAKRVAELSKNDRDLRLARMVDSDLEVFNDPLAQLSEEEPDPCRDNDGPVLHVVGKALPVAQTGYTLRTNYTVRAQADIGIPVVVVVQPGGDGSAHKHEMREHHEDIERIALPGPLRSAVPLDMWLARYVDALEAVVRARRPSLLHAHSDFLNGAAAVLVGRRCGVPVLYESRGFWEESWLSRAGDRLRLGSDPADELSVIGLPEGYSLRQAAERKVRQGADAVATLAEVMREHIQLQHPGGGLPPVYMLPNAVDADSFTPVGRDEQTALELGIRAEDVVIGYVSSMVEYEGIDVLIRAMQDLVPPTGESPTRAHLLLVGDGPVLDRLQEEADRVEASIIFTGRVPHEQVARYYSIIDIFVVPRRPTSVTHLVTPLKPFEAMATGKTVVMSDVRALQEIADQSESVHTFRAGDPDDLRATLQALIMDEEARQQLGRRAREWVLKERTWQANARSSVTLYRELGCRWLEPLANLSRRRLGDGDIDPQQVIDCLATTRPPSSGWFLLDEAEVDALGPQPFWTREGHPSIRLDEPIDWDHPARVDRSWAFHLHAWEFVDAHFAEDRELTAAEVGMLVDHVLGWIDARDARALTGTSDDSMAYYDMALALRVPRLLLILEAASRYDDTRPVVPVLVDLLLHEREKLREGAAFNPATNHGFYTAAAQLHLEKYVPGLPETDTVLLQANARMAELVARQFAHDGGHLEHSPDYHRMVLGSFSDAVTDGLVADSGLVERINRGRRVLGWMAQPDGTLVSMGDSPAHPLSEEDAGDDPETQWIATDGRRGQPSAQEMLVLPDTGYVFVRSPQPRTLGERAASAYLAVQGGFHSRAHKHADDLSFVWYDRGQEICIDAGRYGYGDLLAPEDPLRGQGFYYADPRRQYVESCRAHNTIEMSGQIQDRRRQPYGSAITEAEQHGGAFVITGRAPHGDYIHRRKLNLAPHRRLIIQDSLHSSIEGHRDAVAWFLLDGSLELMEEQHDSLVFRLPAGDVLRVESDRTVIPPVRGQDEPLRGWRSRRVGEWEPAWSFGVQLDVQTRGSARTTFTFDE